MANGQSLALSEMTTAIDAAVKKALSVNPVFDLGGKKPAYFPDLGVFGYFIKGGGFDQRNVGDVVKLTSAIGSGISKFGNAASIIKGDGIIVGYFPIEKLTIDLGQ